MLPFDGLWLDMDEPTNFCDGECADEVHYADKEFTTDIDDMFVYYIGHKKLNDIIVSLDAIHHDGVSEYNLHNLYGFHIRRAANKYFESVKKRPFIISRSTFPGLGRYGSH
jgi:alpha-glucosidase (family GH31 glycosyl hydrolase)